MVIKLENNFVLTYQLEELKIENNRLISRNDYLEGFVYLLKNKINDLNIKYKEQIKINCEDNLNGNT